MNGANPAADTVAASPQTAVDPNQPVIPGYDILELLGKGGMGRVYRARQEAMGRIVALKLMLSGAEQDMARRFQQEIHAVAALHHPNIAQIYETGTASGVPFFTMEFVPGGSLAQRLAGRTIAPRRAASLAAALARGIQHAHECGIVHRDLKPGNVLLDLASPTDADDWIPKIADFGLAKRVAADSPLTRTGEIVGTPGYMAPEQASGVVANIGPAADIYSIGAVLYECVTGRPPFTGPDALRTVMMVLSMDPVPPRRLQPDVPADIETICLKCLEKSPRKRYASAAELAEDLDRFLEGRPIAARPVRMWERGWKWARRKPWQATAAALLLASLVGAGVGLALLDASARDLRDANGQLNGANQALAVQKREADDLLALALHNLNEFTFELSDKLYDLPQGELLRRDVLDRARSSLEAFDRLRPTDAKVIVFQREGYDKLADAEMRLGRLPKALEAETRAREIALRLARDFPSMRAHRLRLAAINCRMAVLNLALGKADECDRFSREAESSIAALLQERPDDVGCVELEALVRYNQYRQAQKVGDKERIESALRSNAAAHRRLTELEPKNADRLLGWADAQTQLAVVLGGTGKHEEASGLLEEAQRRVAEAVLPNTLAARKMRGGLHWTRGDLLAAQGRAGEAEACYRLAYAEYQALAKEFSNTPSHRVSMAQMLISIGSGWKKAEQLERGKDDLVKAVQLLDALKAEQFDNQATRFLRSWAEDLLRELATSNERKK